MVLVGVSAVTRVSCLAAFARLAAETFTRVVAVDATCAAAPRRAEVFSSGVLAGTGGAAFTLRGFDPAAPPPFGGAATARFDAPAVDDFARSLLHRFRPDWLRRLGDVCWRRFLGHVQPEESR